MLRASRYSCESLVRPFEPLVRPFEPLLGPFEPLAGASSFSSDPSGLSLNLSSLSLNLLGLSMGSTRGSLSLTGGSSNPLDDRKKRTRLPARPLRDDDYSGRGREGFALRGRPRKGRRLNSASFSLRLPYCSRTRTR